MFNTQSLKVFLNERNPIVKVQLTRVRGSSPREKNTAMLVCKTSVWGTIGGGQMEYMAIDKARAMLKRGASEAFMDIPLGPEIGQCCGGRVEMSLVRMKDEDLPIFAAEVEQQEKLYPHVYILGAGHVGRALAVFLENLPVRSFLIDNRAEELDLCDADIEKHLSAIPEMDVRSAPAGSAFIILTHDHALDFMLCCEALARNDALYVGMIGSATKRNSFKKWCQSICADIQFDTLICPIGAVGSCDKRPEVIAAFVAAEVMQKLTVQSNEFAGNGQLDAISEVKI